MLWMAGWGEQGSNHFEMCSELPVLLNKGLPSRKSILPVLTQHGFYQGITKVGEGNTISSLLYTSCVTQGESELKSTGGHN